MTGWTPTTIGLRSGVALRKEGAPPGGGSAPRPRTDRETTATPERAVVCAFCQRAITADGARIAVGGAHEHRFVNPSGFVFDVQCFRAAPGCDAVGAPTREFTWFPGFAWQIAWCGGCTTHLGWRFESGPREFWGLIKDRIASRAGG